mmetsp:Transcript_35306/g.94030  ORF Transcript_35306/g.94030 Transcript_35306/m.94030 type:complete len:262 (-) Transcript_35306:157-942(-)
MASHRSGRSLSLNAITEQMQNMNCTKQLNSQATTIVVSPSRPEWGNWHMMRTSHALSCKARPSPSASFRRPSWVNSSSSSVVSSTSSFRASEESAKRRNCCASRVSCHSSGKGSNTFTTPSTSLSPSWRWVSTSVESRKARSCKCATIRDNSVWKCASDSFQTSQRSKKLACNSCKCCSTLLTADAKSPASPKSNASASSLAIVFASCILKAVSSSSRRCSCSSCLARSWSTTLEAVMFDDMMCAFISTTPALTTPSSSTN